MKTTHMLGINADASPLCSLGLTPRETEVLTWIAQGKTNYEIGVILSACTGTIRKHVERILRKLCVENRTAAAAIAFATLAKAKDQPANMRIPKKAKASMTFGSREEVGRGFVFPHHAGGPGTYPPASIMRVIKWKVTP